MIYKMIKLTYCILQTLHTIFRHILDGVFLSIQTSLGIPLLEEVTESTIMLPPVIP